MITFGVDYMDKMLNELQNTLNEMIKKLSLLRKEVADKNTEVIRLREKVSELER